MSGKQWRFFINVVTPVNKTQLSAKNLAQQERNHEAQRASKALQDSSLFEEQQREKQSHSLKGFTDLKSAAEAGDPDSIIRRGEAYELGTGVEKNLEDSEKWLRVAAESGNGESQFKLSQLLAKSGNSEENMQTAIFWAEKAANQNNIGAQNLLGLWYEKGIGVERNYTKALSWYRLTADAGDIIGQKSMGIFYEFGLGVAQNHQKALQWYKLAADQGDERALFFHKQLLDRLDEASDTH